MSINILLAGYLNEVCPYLENLITDLKETINTCKIDLSIKIIFRSSKDNGPAKKMFFRSKYILVKVGDFT